MSEAPEATCQDNFSSSEAIGMGTSLTTRDGTVETARFVIGGPGAFVMTVEGFDTFGFAIANKLVREIAVAPLPPGRAIPASFSAR